MPYIFRHGPDEWSKAKEPGPEDFLCDFAERTTRAAQRGHGHPAVRVVATLVDLLGDIQEDRGAIEAAPHSAEHLVRGQSTRWLLCKRTRKGGEVRRTLRLVGRLSNTRVREAHLAISGQSEYGNGSDTSVDWTARVARATAVHEPRTP